uniref:Uncharacterized protein n=1 Tax=Ananas comosus var. bracteatus TaxID=296719 RepID=A0A6V7PLU2_ANACO|nr:unnamed protein product [Ananas comosus var. bracteatus]
MEQISSNASNESTYVFHLSPYNLVPTLDPVKYSPREERRDDERPRMMTLEVCAHDGSSDSANEGSNQPGSKTSAVNSLRQNEPNGEGKPKIRLRDEPNG